MPTSFTFFPSEPSLGERIAATQKMGHDLVSSKPFAASTLSSVSTGFTPLRTLLTRPTPKSPHWCACFSVMPHHKPRLTYVSCLSSVLCS